MLTRFIKLFKQKLAARLQEKTSWGRNDLSLVIEQVLSETLAELLE